MFEMDLSSLERAVRDELALNPEIKSDINVEVVGDALRISGVVSSSDEKILAEQIAIHLGAEKIQNDIVVESGELSSEQLHREVAKALAKANLSSRSGVEKVIDGVVYLNGRVYSAAEAEEAIKIASEVRGVRDVVSKITLAPEAIAEDSVLVNEVEDAIAAAGVSVENVYASARNGLVYLEGIAWKGRDKERAERAAKSVAGVRGVINRLRAPSEPLSEDERIAWDVLRGLEKAKINAVDVSVAVSAGTAFLDGEVDSEEQRDEATAIALSTPGVDNVRNDLSVKGGSHIEPERAPRRLPREKRFLRGKGRKAGPPTGGRAA